MKALFPLVIILLQLISFSALSQESVFIRIVETRKGCMGIQPQIKVFLSTGSVETIEIEKTEKYMSEDVLLKIKETVDRFLKTGYRISSSSSSFSGNPQECFYLTDYFLIKE